MRDRARTALLALSLLLCALADADEPPTLLVMLQGSSAAAMSRLVQQAGGSVTYELPIIRAVAAHLSRAQLAEILQAPEVTHHIDDLSRVKRPAANPASQAGCRVLGQIALQIKPQEIRWRLFNKGAAPVRLSRLELSWPARLGAVSAVNVDTAAVSSAHYRNAGSGTLAVDFSGAQGPLIVDNAELVVRFQRSSAAQGGPALEQRDFGITAHFAAGCADTLVPGYASQQQDHAYTTVADIDALHRRGVTGKGVTVAVIDSGLWEHPALRTDTQGKPRLLARYNALTQREDVEVVDESGHGTHLTSIIGNSAPTWHNGRPSGTYRGVAPDANLVVVKVLDRTGLAHVLDVVRAIQWVVDHRVQYRIRILNLSFSQQPRWPYWEDPVSQAVLQAWRQGIAVVVAAGNRGPDPQTIGSPGYVPAIITVGAVTDAWTAHTRDDDYIPDLSSQGPTPSGHLKPDIVAPGGHLVGLIPPRSALATDHPEDLLHSGEFVATGSSQAAAVVSGILALLLQLEPGLTPNELKCKLLTSAEPAINRDGKLAYSPFQQGSGTVTATRAVLLGRTDCPLAGANQTANTGNEEDWYGPALVAADGSPTLPGLAGKVSDVPAAKGLSTTRKWGVKAHLERLPAAEAEAAPFDWPAAYQREKAAIEAMPHDPAAAVAPP